MVEALRDAYMLGTSCSADQTISGFSDKSHSDNIPISFPHHSMVNLFWSNCSPYPIAIAS